MDQKCVQQYLSGTSVRQHGEKRKVVGADGGSTTAGLDRGGGGRRQGSALERVAPGNHSAAVEHGGESTAGGMDREDLKKMKGKLKQKNQKKI